MVGWGSGALERHNSHRLILNSSNNTHPNTGGKPITSPSTNLAIDAAMAILAPDVRARGQVLDFKALQREWQQATWAQG